MTPAKTKRKKPPRKKRRRELPDEATQPPLPLPLPRRPPPSSSASTSSSSTSSPSPSTGAVSCVPGCVGPVAPADPETGTGDVTVTNLNVLKHGRGPPVQRRVEDVGGPASGSAPAHSSSADRTALRESSSQLSAAPSSQNFVADDGYDIVSSNLQSVLSHPVALLLVYALHENFYKRKPKSEFGGVHIEGDGNSNDNVSSTKRSRMKETMNDAQPEGLRHFLRRSDVASSLVDHRAAFDRLLSNVGGTNDIGRFNNVLQASYDGYRDAPSATEHILTTEIYRNIEEEVSKLTTSSPSMPPLQVCHQYGLAYHPVDAHKKSRADILIHHRRDKNDNKSAMVLLLEVGLETKPKKHDEGDLEWWTKVDQNAKYLRYSQESDNEASNVQFLGPMLFAVLTIANAKGEGTTEFHSARLGVFLCVPRPKHPGTDETTSSSGFRITLLRRDRLTSLRKASFAFGRMLRAVRGLAELLHDVEGGCVFKNYQFLGPNCCRIGEKVLRAYDNRLRHTHRRPDVYGNASIAPDARVVCRHVDKSLVNQNCKHEFKLCDNRGPVTGFPKKRLWLWEFKGELLVIETKYHQGQHFAKEPKEFIPIVEHLQKMHVAGYVHGDIRCANIVFGQYLIDFDMGGRIKDSPRYPPGYVQLLTDGHRRGVGGALITVSEDWYALLEIIFHLHGLVPPALPSTQSSADLEKRHNRLSRLTRSTGETSLEDSLVLQDLALDLIEYLKDVEKGTFLHNRSFLEDFVNKWGGIGATKVPPRVTSEPATGSPPK